MILTGRGYDPLQGYSGCEAVIYPGLADSDVRRGLVAKIAPQNPPDSDWPVHVEAAEVAWLLGSPFFVQVIEGPGDEIAEVFAGLGDTCSDGTKRLNAHWKKSIAEPADTVIVTLTGDPARHDFAALARAAACGARVVKPGGNIVILSEAEPELGGATDVLRRSDDPPEAVQLLLREKPADAAAAMQWSWAAEKGKIHLASEIRPTTVKEMFATPLTGPKDVQRLLDAPGRCVIIPDAHKSWVVTVFRFST